MIVAEAMYICSVLVHTELSCIFNFLVIILCSIRHFYLVTSDMHSSLFQNRLRLGSFGSQRGNSGFYPFKMKKKKISSSKAIFQLAGRAIIIF